jgi:hypothetical protein
MGSPDPDIDRTLNDLWSRRGVLSHAEWDRLYQLVRRILRARSFSEYGALPWFAPVELINDFFYDKVFLPATRPALETSAVHAGALCLYFQRYLIQRIRAARRDPDYGDKHEPSTNEQATREPGTTDPNVDDEAGYGPHTTRSLPLPDASRSADLQTLLWQAGLEPSEVLASAAQFMARAEPWVRLYLAEHFCAESDAAVPISGLSKRHGIRSSHYKAERLGITHPRSGFASPRDWADTLLGRWVESLGIRADAANRSVTKAVLEILCLAALSAEAGQDWPVQ